jgi:hypothetical protein
VQLNFKKDGVPNQGVQTGGGLVTINAAIKVDAKLF